VRISSERHSLTSLAIGTFPEKHVRRHHSIVPGPRHSTLESHAQSRRRHVISPLRVCAQE
jgi:hypothetical protein